MAIARQLSADIFCHDPDYILGRWLSLDVSSAHITNGETANTIPAVLMKSRLRISILCLISIS